MTNLTDFRDIYTRSFLQKPLWEAQAKMLTREKEITAIIHLETYLSITI